MPITKQTIAIIGASGIVGSAIAKGIAGGNYRLLLFDVDLHKSDALKKEILQEFPKADVQDMNCAHECGWEADLIILDVSEEQLNEIARKIQTVATQKVVAFITGGNSREAKKIAEWLPYSKIVNIYIRAKLTDFENGIKISGNDQDALQSITELFQTAGFTVSAALKPLNPAYYMPLK